MSLSLGVISQTKKLVIFSLATLVFAWSSETLTIAQLPADNAVVWLFSFVLYDFLYYWFHRFSHQINFLWASHVVHHQSEEYNLTTALRQTSSSVMPWLFYIPSFIVGIPAEVFFVSGALNLVYQYWVHTQLIGKLGWFESIFVTPSHHRVHHGQNEIYIDKNHGGVFIIWDRLFGTFQVELDHENVVYGVRRPVKSFNPLWANVHTWVSLLSDAFRTKSWLDKVKIWFMPTGWRPADVEKSYPIVKQAAGKQLKYDPKSSSLYQFYALFQYAACVLIGVIFIQTATTLSWDVKLLYWFLITIPLVSIGFLTEGRYYGLALETARLIFTGVVLLSGAAPELFKNASELYVSTYLVVSMMLLFIAKVFSKSSLTQQKAG